MLHNKREGLVYAGLAYSFWGILPIYWKLLDHISANELLANRIFWSFWFMLILLMIGKKMPDFTNSLKQFSKQPKIFLALTLASILISCNWFLFIWAVNTERIIETSLGYYINPLVSVMLGVIVLKEKLTRLQIGSFIIALIGVLIMTVSYGQFPWVSFALAVSFGAYGLVKKLIQVDSSIGLTLETMVMMPIALIYIIFQYINGNSSLFVGSISTDILLMASGAVTAIPLLYFAKGVQFLPLYLIGFMQYIAPTITLFLGVFLYGEPFGTHRFIAFTFIWIALALFTVSGVKWSHPIRKNKKRVA